MKAKNKIDKDSNSRLTYTTLWLPHCFSMGKFIFTDFFPNRLLPRSFKYTSFQVLFFYGIRRFCATSRIFFFYCSYVEHQFYAQQFLKMHVAQLVAYRTLARWHSLCTNDSYIYKNVLYMFQLKWYCALCNEMCIKGSAHTGRCPSVHCQKQQKNLSHMRTLLGKRLLKGDRVV